MKTVWIINHYSVLPDEPGSTRHYSLAKRLSERRWKCWIIAASYSHWEKKQRIDPDKKSVDFILKSVTFRFIWTPGYAGSGIKRIINILYFTLALLRKRSTIDMDKPDVIIGSSAHLLAAWAAKKLAKRYDVPFVFEVRDLWPHTLVIMEKIRSGSIITRLLQLLEKSLYKSAEKIVVLMPGAHEYICSLGVDYKKIVWIPNGVENVSNDNVFNKNSVFTIIYLGAHGQANSLDTILEAIAILKKSGIDQQIQFRFIGEGDHKERLRQNATANGLSNVKFEEGVPKSRVQSVLSEADAFILAMNNLPELYKYGVSLNKIFDYMAAGRPIIAAINSVNNPIEEAGAGISVMPNSPSLLADAIESMMHKSEEERLMMGMKGRIYVQENYSYDILANQYRKVLEEVLVYR